MNYLIIGLGNIGPEYHKTRHNIGFDVLDYLAEQREVSFASNRYASTAEFRFKARKFVLVKPSTYMNLSGKAVRYWMTEKKINIENILVIVDDIALPFGKLRLRTKGSDGGHNGLKDINAKLETQKYARLRFGIGDEFSVGRQVDFVLGKWTNSELSALETPIKRAAEAIVSYCTIGAQRTMEQLNKG